MTGTGTQNDPYIVGNWSEIVEAAAKSDVYVKCVPNLQIDWNDIDPTGKTHSIQWYCAEFDGNGLVISGIYVCLENYSNCLFNNSLGGTIKNINFLNFNIANGGLFQQASRYSDRWENLAFIGNLTGRNTKLFGNSVTRIEYCYFDLKLFGGAYVSGANIWLYHTILNIENDKNSNNDYLKLYGDDFIFRGSYGNRVFANAVQRAIFDFELTYGDASYFTVTNMDKSSMALYNNDKIPIENPAIIPVTTEQLKNPDYLRSIGFPIRTAGE